MKFLKSLVNRISGVRAVDDTCCRNSTEPHVFECDECNDSFPCIVCGRDL